MKDKTRMYLSLILLILLLTACGAPLAPTGEPTSAPIAAGTEAPTLAEARSPATRDNPDVALAQLQTLVEGNTAFAVDLYQQLREEDDGNLFFSPHSISLALAMTYAGARGETAEQMAQTLHFPFPQETLHPTFNALDLALQPDPTNEETFALHIANSLWGERTYAFLDAFLEELARNYGAGLNLMDFMGDPDGARQAINDWVSDQTNEKIQNLLAPGVITPMTRLVLANAIYFNAQWLYPFNPEATRDQPFTLLDGSQVNAPMMFWGEAQSLPYTQGDTYQAVALPYKGGEAEMIVLLPDAGEFTAFEAALTAAQLAEIVAKLDHTRVNVRLPRFSYSSEFSLADTLAALGMPAAMIAGQADFSGMDGTRELYIGAVIHKAFVAVDEAGTEAAAATAVVMLERAMAPNEHIEFLVDRPFLYLIRETETGAVLFLGRVVNPVE